MVHWLLNAQPLVFYRNTRQPISSAWSLYIKINHYLNFDVERTFGDIWVVARYCCILFIISSLYCLNTSFLISFSKNLKQIAEQVNLQLNKKVLLRERKRHTARRVVSTPSVVLTGYPPGRVPPPPAGYPPQLDLAGYPPRCLPHGILGNVAKHYGIWVPPRCLAHGILGNVAKHCGIWVPPPQVWTDKVKLLPSRRTTYAGGNQSHMNDVLTTLRISTSVITTCYLAVLKSAVE